MVVQAEYKSIVGLDQVHVALVTQDDAAAYVADVPEVFAPAIDASAEPESAQDIQYADDQPFDIMTSEGVTKITLSTTNIPISILAKYLGKVFDTVSGRMFDQAGQAVPPDAALSFRSMKSNGSYRYFQYLKGKFSVPKDEASTKAEKATPKPAQIMFTAMSTVHVFDLGDINKSVKRVVGDEDSANFSGTSFFDAVQTPVIVAPDALALSSSVPGDGTTDISVSANQTLTFNNALPDSVINNILLIDPSDGSTVASAYTLDATKKIVTVNPTESLSADTDYIITYTVTDIYGQTLKGAINFTTLA
jgi:phi13 family phage major tail protein